ncbi:MAG: response regulator [Candidatus Pacebacteria bacterium]|nr:response regulator [Candidatus Paceibacterota bacterium]
MLVVDDDEAVRKTVVEILKSFGFSESIEAADGLEAWDNFFCCGDSGIRLIVSDREMPNWDGLDLLRAVRGRTQEHKISFVLMSGESLSKEEILEADRLGSFFIGKPFASIAHFQEAIEYAEAMQK